MKHFLEVLDEVDRIGVEYVSFRENIEIAGPLGRALVVIIVVIAELERLLIVERVRAGMRRARLDGQSLRQIAKGHRVSTATIQRVLRGQAVNSQERVA